MVDMLAPRSHFEHYTSNAKLYVAGEDALLRDVEDRDIQDLVNSGCRTVVISAEVEVEAEVETSQAPAGTTEPQPLPRAPRAPRTRGNTEPPPQEVPAEEQASSYSLPSSTATSEVGE